IVGPAAVAGEQRVEGALAPYTGVVLSVGIAKGGQAAGVGERVVTTGVGQGLRVLVAWEAGDVGAGRPRGGGGLGLGGGGVEGVSVEDLALSEGGRAVR